MLRVPLEDLAEGERDLPEEASRYLIKVRRMRAGDRCVAFDPAARLEADLEILHTRHRGVRVALSRLRPSSQTAGRALALIQGLAKGSKVEAVIRDATELGASHVIVTRTARSVKREVDLVRCRRVALEAARQAGRGDVPDIEHAGSMAEAVALCPEGLRIVLSPEAEAPLGELALRGRHAITLAVGPEGGFDGEELALLSAAGFVAARLGSFVLRTETVCAAALGAVAAAG